MIDGRGKGCELVSAVWVGIGGFALWIFLDIALVKDIGPLAGLGDAPLVLYPAVVWGGLCLRQKRESGRWCLGAAAVVTLLGCALAVVLVISIGLRFHLWIGGSF